MKVQYKSGSDTRDGNRMMLKNQAVEFKHHANELSNAVKKAKHVDAWVVAKAERATTDLSDITHYLDGQSESYAKGGLMPGGYVLSQLSDTEAIDLANATLKDEVGYVEDMMFNSGYAARRFLREYHSGKADVDEEAVVDRFSQTDDLTDEARDIVEKYRDINHDEDSISEMRDELMAVGYVFDYDDDMIPYSLRRIGEEDDDDGMFADGGMMADGGKKELLPKEELIRVLQSVDFQSFSSSDIKEIEYEYGSYNPFDKNFEAKIKAYPCLIDIRKREGGLYLVRIGKDDGWIGGLLFTATEYVFNIKKITIQDFEEGLRNAVKNNIVTLYSKYGTGNIDKIYFNGTEQDAEKFALKNGYKKEQTRIMPTGFSYYFFNPNLPTYKSEKILYIQRFDDAKVKELGIKNIGNNIVKANGGMMAKGGQIDADEVEKAAKIYADNPNWTVEKLKREVSEHEDLLENWEAGYIKPSKVIGTGYKSSSVARKLADNWIRRQLAIFTKALELKQQMNQKAIPQVQENHPKVGDDVRGFNHKYGTTIKDVDTNGRRFKIKQSDYWDSADIWVSFDDVTQDEDDDRTWRREIMPTINMKRKPGEIMVGDKIVKLKYIKRCCPSIKSDGSVGDYEYSFVDEQGNPYTGYGNTKEEALKSIEDYLNKAPEVNVSDNKNTIQPEEASIGDSALVVSENKLGTISNIDFGMYYLKFVDGRTKWYNASDLRFFKDEDDYPDEETSITVNSEQEAADARELLELFSEQEINDLIGGLEVLVELGDKNSEDELAKWRRIIALSAANVDADDDKIIAYTDDPGTPIGTFKSREEAKKFAKANKSKYDEITFEDNYGEYFKVTKDTLFASIDFYFDIFLEKPDNPKMASGGIMAKGGAMSNKKQIGEEPTLKQMKSELSRLEKERMDYLGSRNRLTERASLRTDKYQARIDKLMKEIREKEDVLSDKYLFDEIKSSTPGKDRVDKAAYVIKRFLINRKNKGLITKLSKFKQSLTSPSLKEAYRRLEYATWQKKYMFKLIISNSGDTIRVKEWYADGGMMSKGGATFEDKVTAISGRLEGTQVPRRLRSDYGRRYNKEEAKKAAQRIAGAMIKKGY